MDRNVALMPQRPPYVEFETRSEEDRTRTIEEGVYGAKDVDYAIIRAIGAKDAVEKPAVEWLKHLDHLASLGMWPKDWVDFFKKQYKEWKAGNNMEVNGIHVKNWPGISPAQRDMLIAVRILTVQDVADANEETLQRIGMGARQLKQRAQAFLDTIQNGKSSEELAMLRDKTANQQQKIDELTAKVELLVARIEELDDGESGAKPQSRRKAS
jgi:cell division protein FtsB